MAYPPGGHVAGKMYQATTSQTRLLLLGLLLLASVNADRYTLSAYDLEPVQDIQGGIYALLDGGAEVSKGLIEGGGSMQLFLVIAFCCVVLCCASMSISPWHKSDNFLLRKAMALLYVGGALPLDSLGRKGDSGFTDEKQVGATGKGRQKGHSAQKNASKNREDSLATAEKQSRKAARSKRRKQNAALQEQSGSQPSQIVKSVSMSSSQSSSYEVKTSVLSTEPDEADSLAASPPPESPRTVPSTSIITPLEQLAADALRPEPRKGSKSAASKQHVNVSVDTVAPAAQAAPATQSSSAASQTSTPTLRSPAQAAKKDIAPRTPVRTARPVAASRKKEVSSPRDRAGRKGQVQGAGEKPSHIPQVLVVPRSKPRSKERRAKSEGGDDPVAPGTPDFGATTSFSIQSSLRSPPEPPRLTRPYADVAREHLQQQAPQATFRQPQMQPISPNVVANHIQELSPLPRHAAAAAPFVPAARSRLTPLAQPFLPLNSSMYPPPPMQPLAMSLSSVPTPLPPPPPSCSLFSGSHMHRSSPLGGSALGSSAFGGLYFPGKDSIWKFDKPSQGDEWSPWGSSGSSAPATHSASWEGSQSLQDSLSPQSHLARQDSC